MKMKNKLSLCLLLLNFVWISLSASSQSEASFPKKESRPYFKLLPYPRGFEKDSLEHMMSYLLEKPGKHWDRKDSLQYMYTLIGSSNYDLAYKIFEQQSPLENLTEDQFHIIQHMLLYKYRYKEYHEWLKLEEAYFPYTKKQIEIRSRIAEVNRKQVDRVWSLKDSVLFPELLDPRWKSYKKGGQEYLSILVPLLREYDDALRDETKYESASNRALSLAFYEFGKFLKKHVSLSDAYIAYSISRYYDKYNNDVAVDLRAIKNEMNKRNYIFPSIREIFPKQRKGIFNYKKIMEKRKAQQDSTLHADYPPLKIDPDKLEDPVVKGLWDEFILIGGLVLILICVLVFIRIDKKRKE